MLKKMEEKKVEYIELVYDLIFVYIISTNNHRLQVFENGFIRLDTYIDFFLSMLIILQVWSNTTLLINRYGRNDRADHIGIFVNMYLLYYMIAGTNASWELYYVQYNTAWGLILVSLGIQYLLKGRNGQPHTPGELAHLKQQSGLLLLQAVLVFSTIPIYLVTGQALTWAALALGFLITWLTRKSGDEIDVDFSHLSERMMLFVVFTFGEMIISIMGYFAYGFTPTGVYFSLLTFLIVVGLLLSYGFFYERIIDRNLQTGGVGYMLIHVVLITALNSISAGLEFMQNPAVDQLPKSVFLVVSFVVYYLFLFLCGRYAIRKSPSGLPFFLRLIPLLALFALLIALFYPNPAISLVISVLFVYAVLGLIYHSWKTFQQSPVKPE